LGSFLLKSFRANNSINEFISQQTPVLSARTESHDTYPICFLATIVAPLVGLIQLLAENG
jgi:hypothetical protein